MIPSKTEPNYGRNMKKLDVERGYNQPLFGCSGDIIGYSQQYEWIPFGNPTKLWKKKNGP